MVAKFDYFHIGYATAAAAIKFSFFVQVISAILLVILPGRFQFPGLSPSGSLPEVFFRTRGWAPHVQPHMIISLKSSTCPALSTRSVRQGRGLSRIEYLGQIFADRISRVIRRRVHYRCTYLFWSRDDASSCDCRCAPGKYRHAPRAS